MFDSIKTRLIALGVGIVALTLLTITVANYVTVRGHTRQQVSQSLDELAAARSDAIRQWVRSQRDIVASLQPAVAAADPVPLLQQAAKSGRLEAAYVGFADKKIVFNTPQNLPADYDPTGRPWYTGAASASGTVLTAPYMDASKGRLVVTFAAADKSGGATKAVIATDVFLDDVVATVQAIKPTPGGFAFLMSKDGKIVAHPDAKLALKDATAVSDQLTPQALATALDPAAGWVEANVGGDVFLVSGTPIADTDWQLFVAAKKDEALASLGALLRTAVITALIMMAVAALAMTGTISAMLSGVDRVRAALDDISAGDGDLTQRLPAGGRDEVGRIAASFNLFAEKIQRILLDVRSASNSITTASSEIAIGSQDLSQRTEETASNLQQAASSMEELTATVRQTADAAQTANQLASSASSAAARGGQVVGQVVSTMDEITASSRKINDIIGTIDGIAFQTNILALNAAVEAARAGEQGRGFAVVASEVRSLAQRSAEAAKEIKTLIGASVTSVEAGSRLVQAAGESMSDIVGSVQRVTDIIGEITAASTEQSSGIAQVNDAVVQLDRMTQQNAALVEESAAAAESLKDQAHRLTEIVSVFRLGADGMPAVARTAKPASAARPAATAASAATTGPAKASQPAAGSTAARKSPPAPLARKAPSASPSPNSAATEPATAAAPAAKSPPRPLPPSAPPPPRPAPAADDGDWETF
ncbi:methyl-accepting chemotaxis protein [Roseateles chitinivorans]|uniref:methyl-accepting chemotaxis protein n=1 Tax=Roseateles chitinivorans TaxID=2917965 RepID=UPI003D6716AD